ncbi:hypothetical protein DRP53_08145 [candidate division WOR-3 bacterium]|uniref:Uncharacterized protein n=1 Tax=candidate division WOR-3 bacterium TaxID=2052148 RepID=A0A660SFJ4_UNCW3|nr:MAG: hypothetical protein DRP53_08145 [candidate division WOR-3 bacterium]
MALDAELHADLEALLIDDGSEPEDLWGINLYPFQKRDNFIEYVALINIRPSLGNYSMEIDDETLRKRIAEIVWDLIDYET